MKNDFIKFSLICAFFLLLLVITLEVQSTRKKVDSIFNAIKNQEINLVTNLVTNSGD